MYITELITQEQREYCDKKEAENWQGAWFHYVPKNSLGFFIGDSKYLDNALIDSMDGQPVKDWVNTLYVLSVEEKEDIDLEEHLEKNIYIWCE